MGICGKVKGYGEGRSEATSTPKPEGFAANSPGSSGFRLADAHLSGGIARSHDIGLATFRVVRLAIPETELIPSKRPLL